MKSRIVGTIIGLSISGVIGFMFLLAFWLWFDYRVPPLSLSYSHPTTVEYGAKSRADVKEVRFIKAGSAFYTYREFCVEYAFDSVKAKRVLVSKSDPKEIFPLPELPSRVDATVDCLHKTFASMVPVETPPGEYWYRSSTIYTVHGNPIGQWTWHWPDVTVLVVPK